MDRKALARIPMRLISVNALEGVGVRVWAVESQRFADLRSDHRQSMIVVRCIAFADGAAIII